MRDAQEKAYLREKNSWLSWMGFGVDPFVSRRFWEGDRNWVDKRTQADSESRGSGYYSTFSEWDTQQSLKSLIVVATNLVAFGLGGIVVWVMWWTCGEKTYDMREVMHKIRTSRMKKPIPASNPSTNAPDRFDSRFDQEAGKLLSPDTRKSGPAVA